MDFEPLINAEQAGRLLDCSAKTVKRMAEDQEIPAIQIGNRWKFRASLLDEWLRAKLESRRRPCPKEKQ